MFWKKTAAKGITGTTGNCTDKAGKCFKKYCARKKIHKCLKKLVTTIMGAI